MNDNAMIAICAVISLIAVIAFFLVVMLWG